MRRTAHLRLVVPHDGRDEYCDICGAADVPHVYLSGDVQQYFNHHEKSAARICQRCFKVASALFEYAEASPQLQQTQIDIPTEEGEKK